MAAVQEPTWSVTAITAVIGTVLAVLSFITAWLALRHNTRALQLQALQSIFHDIRELERQYIEKFDTWSGLQKNAWCATFFNTLEFLCFVVNRKLTKDKELRRFFFPDALPEWRKLLDAHTKAGYIRNEPEMFQEFKKAYREITGQTY